MHDFVKKLNRERGVTVILTTHDMHDLEALTERVIVIVIGNGLVLADGTLAALRRGVLAEHRLWVHFARDVEALDVPHATVRRHEGRSIELAFDPAEITAHELIAANLIAAIYPNLVQPEPVGHALLDWLGQSTTYRAQYAHSQARFDRGEPNAEEALLYYAPCAADVGSMVILGDPAATLPRLR